MTQLNYTEIDKENISKGNEDKEGKWQLPCYECPNAVPSQPDGGEEGRHCEDTLLSATCSNNLQVFVS